MVEYLGFSGQVQEIWDTAASASRERQKKNNVTFYGNDLFLLPYSSNFRGFWLIEMSIRQLSNLIINVASSSSSAKLDFGCSSEILSGQVKKTQNKILKAH